MTLSTWVMFTAIGLLDFFWNLKKMSKKDLRLYIFIFLLFQILYVLVSMDKIPHHFASIVKVW
ncbi:MAG: hypothetical protein CVU84_07320 [Firmicutes bacterium HGW-Firmicutes-1]|jgi:hypothetical protein|nr:MAG: hypothetical protein CVU84_07320 [Firmicutes bacterium HGW-Firmicutes-1]